MVAIGKPNINQSNQVLIDMKKRNLFDELMSGVDALKQEREGKLTLKQVKLAEMPDPVIDPEEIRSLRESNNLSRPVFARMIRTKTRTLESWEQGRTKPNTHAILLLKLVKEFPDTLQQLKAV